MLQEALELAVVLSQLTPRPEDVAMGLSELLINAVEHGNLTFDDDETSTLLAEWRWNNAVSNWFVRVAASLIIRTYKTNAGAEN